MSVSSPRIRIQVNLARHPSAILLAVASAQGVSKNSLAHSLLEKSLLAMSVPVGPQAEAEGALMRWVEDTVIHYRVSDTWGEHITLTIFDRIRDELMQTYDAAILGGHKARINRTISRLIRQTLGPVTRRTNGSVRAVRLPSNSHLIGGYTCVYRMPA